MAKSKESFNKKEKEKKQKKRQDKQQRKEDRKSNSGGKSFEDMLAYVDEFGNLTTTPPDPTQKKSTVKAEDIEIGIARKEDADEADLIRKGTITFFNESKGYGFIKDHESQESIFLHVNQLTEQVKENDKVTFETEKGPKGLSAVRVSIIK